MIRMLGLILISVCCIWIGEKQVGNLKGRVKLLAGLEQALEEMERELSTNLTPLPQLMDRLYMDSTPPAAFLFSSCREALDHLDVASFSDIWKSAVLQLEGLAKDDCSILVSLGNILGRYESSGQVRAVSDVRHQLQQNLAQARTDLQQQGKICRTVCAAGGAFLIILLL